MDAKDEIKQRLDLCDVIAEYIQLKPAGTHAMKAVCPFHSEKTPSFHVSRDKQIWRCFGCSLGGDMFSFVMQMEGVDFPEALRILGKRLALKFSVSIRAKRMKNNAWGSCKVLRRRFTTKCCAMLRMRLTPGST